MEIQCFLIWQKSVRLTPRGVTFMEKQIFYLLVLFITHDKHQTLKMKKKNKETKN